MKLNIFNKMSFLLEQKNNSIENIENIENRICQLQEEARRINKEQLKLQEEARRILEDAKSLDAKSLDAKSLDAKSLDAKSLDAKSLDEEFNDENEEFNMTFKEFLKIKMTKRNGMLKDEDGKDGEDIEDIEIKTDFIFDIAPPVKSDKKNKKSDSKKDSDKDINKEKEEFDFIPISKLQTQKKFVIKGLVQSGKTEYMICLMLYMLLSGKSVVFVVRNIEDDRIQFCKRFIEFKKKYQQHFSELKDIYLIDNILKYKSSKYDNDNNIYLLLDNQNNIRKMNTILLIKNVRYVTIFDEADFVDSGNGMKAKQYDILKARSSKIFWVSATIMDMLGKEEGISGDNIIFLNPSDKKNYKGIINNKIKMETIPKSKYVGLVNEDVFECNPYFSIFLEEYKRKDIFGEHPRICLVNLSHCIEPLEKAQVRISEEHPELSIIVYNSPGLVFQKGSKRIYGENIKFKGFEGSNISSFLQYLKENGGIKEHKHIIILSGYMAGRGISFVSEDYGWHLTDEYLVMSKTSDEPELIQKVRLQGIYKDDIPLTLYTTEDVQKDLLKASLRIEELSQACKNTESESKKLLTEIEVHKEKFTKRDMTKNISLKMKKVRHNIGWSLDIYRGLELISNDHLSINSLEISEEDRKTKEDEIRVREKYKIDEKEENYEDDEEEDIRLFKMFKRWRGDKSTKISSFLHNFNPTKKYTEYEIKDLCKSTNVVLRHLMVDKYEKSYGYGKIIEKIGNSGNSFNTEVKYQLRKSLVDEFNKIFS